MGLCISNAFLWSVSSLRLRADVRYSDVWYCNKMARAVLTGTKQESSFAKHTLTFKIDFWESSAHGPSVSLLWLSHCIIWCSVHHKIPPHDKTPLMQCSTYVTRLGGRNLWPFCHSKIVLYVSPASRQGYLTVSCLWVSTAEDGAWVLRVYSASKFTSGRGGVFHT